MVLGDCRLQVAVAVPHGVVVVLCSVLDYYLLRIGKDEILCFTTMNTLSR